MTKLDQLASMSTVVADTGDIDAIAQLKPVDATTNPSLLLKAAGLARFDNDVSALKGSQDAADEFAVRVGSQIVQLVPGVISTEVDARLSFDTDRTIAKAESLIDRYAKVGVDASRVLIKIASTWEGIRAAAELDGPAAAARRSAAQARGGDCREAHRGDRHAEGQVWR